MKIIFRFILFACIFSGVFGAQDLPAQSVSDYQELTTPKSTDILYIIEYPPGPTRDRFITVGNLFSFISGTYAPLSHDHDSSYISKVATPTAGNFPTVTAGGELENSAYGPSSFAAASHSHAASDITSGTLDNARVNWAAPSPIGGTTPAAGAFTTLSAGAGGFSVDADGDVVAKSITITRTAGQASYWNFYEVPANGDNYIQLKPPDSLSADYTLTLPAVTGTLLATGGIVSGKVGTVTKSSAYTLGTDFSQEAYGYMVFLSGTTTLTLPSVVQGMSFCVYSTDAAVKTIDPNSSDRIRLDGTAQSDGVTITSDGAAGDYICLVADSSEGWTSIGYGKTAWNTGS